MALEFLFLLGLVGTGSRWRAGIGYLPPGHSAAGKSGKTGVLGANGEPAIGVDGKKLTAKQKAEIAKKDEEMRNKELGIEPKPVEKVNPESKTNAKEKKSPRLMTATEKQALADELRETGAKTRGQKAQQTKRSKKAGNFMSQLDKEGFNKDEKSLMTSTFVNAPSGSVLNLSTGLSSWKTKVAESLEKKGIVKIKTVNGMQVAELTQKGESLAEMGRNI